MHRTVDCDLRDGDLVTRRSPIRRRSTVCSEGEVIREIMLKPMPKGVFVTIAELYGITAFLVSDYARNINGQTITVDGGWTVR